MPGSTDFKYYIYAYLRESNQTPYYIGKGVGKKVFKNHGYLSVPNDKSKIGKPKEEHSSFGKKLYNDGIKSFKIFPENVTPDMIPGKIKRIVK